MSVEAIRSTKTDDRPTLLALQSYLQAPSPLTLDAALTGAGVVLVAAPNDAPVPVGYCLAIPGDETAWIAELAVVPARRREGWGKRLLDTCCRELAAAHEVARLAVAPNNDGAIKLYQSLGFEQVDRRPGFYDSSAALVFERSLSG